MAWESKEGHRETKFGTWLHPELNLSRENEVPAGRGVILRRVDGMQDT